MTPETHPIEKVQLMAYLDGELSLDNAKQIAAHLEQCAECRELAADFRGLSSRMLNWNVEPSPKALTEGVKTATGRLNGLSREKGKVSSVFFNAPWRRVLSNRWLWATAFGLVCVAITLGLRIQPMGKEAARSLPPKKVDYFKTEVLPQASNNEQQEPLAGPMIARTASLKISVKSLSDAHVVMDRIVTGHQGYVASLNVSSESGAPQSLEAKVAIPSAQYDAAVAELKGLGRVEREQQGGEEVTARVVDLAARLKNARETEAQLTEVLRTRTGKIDDVLEVEKEMARVREEIEQMQAEQKQLTNRVTFASIDVSLTEQYQAQLGSDPSSANRQIRNALVDGYHAAADGLLNVLLFLLTAGPTVILWALILFWPARGVWRRWRQSHADNGAGF